MAAKMNEGDIIEGIITLAMGLFVAYGDVDKTKLNQLRTQINPQKFVDGRETIVVVKDRQDNLDKVTVTVSLRMKAATTSMAYGADFQPLYESQKDIGDLDKKIDQIIKNVSFTNFGRTLFRVKDKYVQNSKAEYLDFQLTADGIAGELTGGKVKGDVDVALAVAEDGGRTQPVQRFRKAFSIKSASITVANLAPYKNLKHLMAMFGGKWSTKEHYYDAVFSKNAKTTAEKEAANQVLKDMFSEFAGHLSRTSSSDDMTKRAFAFLIASTHGTDLADIVDISKSKVKEAQYNYLKFLSQGKMKLKAIIITSGDGAVIRFVDAAKPNDKSPKNMLFQFRLKLRVSQSSGSVERKLYVEVGDLVYWDKQKFVDNRMTIVGPTQTRGMSPYKAPMRFNPQVKYEMGAMNYYRMLVAEAKKKS